MSAPLPPDLTRLISALTVALVDDYLAAQALQRQGEAANCSEPAPYPPAQQAA